MKIEYIPCKKCDRLGVKISVADGYYTFRKGFVGKSVRIYHPKKETILTPICEFCGFDNVKEVKIISKKEMIFKELVYKI